jgi:hypothetical protein
MAPALWLRNQANDITKLPPHFFPLYLDKALASESGEDVHANLTLPYGATRKAGKHLESLLDQSFSLHESR